MKIKKIVAFVSFVVLAWHVSAQAQDNRKYSNSPVEIVSQKLKVMYPNTTFTDIRPSLITGLFEVTMGQNMAYTDSNSRYFVFGRLFDMKEQVDLTAQRQQKQQANLRVEYPSELLTKAIKTIKGDGNRQLVVFSDPNCPYCKNLERELAKLDNITVHTFLYPVLGEESKTLANAVWCAADKEAAWSALMLRQIRPALSSTSTFASGSESTSCVTPINDIMDLGSKLGISGTPTLIATDGRILPGAASAEKINAWLGEVK